ncbi:MAG: ABC transporter permease [Bacillota bacterium]
MRQYLIRRLIYSITGLLLISCLLFVMLQLAPGGPTILLGETLSETDKRELARNLGMDKPIHIRLWRWLSSLLRGNMGFSFNAAEPALSVIMDRLPNTLLLASSAMVLSCLIAIPVGVVAATRRYSLLDYSVTLGSFLGISMPGFWLGLLLITLLSVKWRILPSAGITSIGAGGSFGDRIKHLIMPTITLSTGLIGEIARYTRSSMINVLGEDYVRTAKAKGLSERKTVYRHALRNALIPVVTVVAGIVPSLLGGAVITETVFAWPGMGRLGVESALSRDYPVVMGLVVIISTLVVVLNFIVDMLYGWLDPRVRMR